LLVFFFQAEDGIRDFHVTGVQTCALPICKLQTYEATEKGNAFMNEYGRIRRNLLTDRTADIDGIDARMAESTALLRMLIGIYDRSEERRVGKEGRLGRQGRSEE